MSLKKLKIAGKRGDELLITEAKTTDGRSIVGADGDFNASSRKELGEVLAAVADATTAGIKLTTIASATSRQEAAKSEKSNFEILAAAFASGDESEFMRVVAAPVRDEVAIANDRDGLVRRIMGRADLRDGNSPIIEVNRKDLRAQVATGPLKAQLQLTSNNIIRPEEFTLQHRVFISHKDIKQSNSDIVQSRYMDVLQAIMVQEDRTWKTMADATVGSQNNLAVIGGTFSPAALASMKESITRWNLDASTLLISSDIMTDIISDAAWNTLFNATSAAEEVVQTGSMGNIYGINVLTDAYRHESQKVLDRGDIYVLSKPEQHGQYTDRDGLHVEEISAKEEGIAGKGFNVYELMSMAIVNDRTIVRGIR